MGSMLKSETGMPSSSNNQGFTLIEIMVVLMILSITIGAAVLAFGDFGGTERAQSEAQRFRMKLNLAKKHAIIENLAYRVDVEPHGYRIMSFSPPNSWHPAKNKHLKAYTFPESMGAMKKASILIQPSGEITPFSFTFQNAKGKTVATVENHGYGTISLHK